MIKNTNSNPNSSIYLGVIKKANIYMSKFPGFTQKHRENISTNNSYHREVFKYNGKCKLTSISKDISNKQSCIEECDKSSQCK